MAARLTSFSKLLITIFILLLGVAIVDGISTGNREVTCTTIHAKWEVPTYVDGVLIIKRGITTNEGLFEMNDDIFNNRSVQFHSLILNEQYSFTAYRPTLSRQYSIRSQLTQCQ